MHDVKRVARANQHNYQSCEESGQIQNNTQTSLCGLLGGADEVTTSRQVRLEYCFRGRLANTLNVHLLILQGKHYF